MSSPIDWARFYEGAWRARLAVVKQFVEEEGETSLARVLARFERFEQTHVLAPNSTTGEVRWRDAELPAETGFAGIPWFRPVAYAHSTVNLPYHMHWSRVGMLLDVLDKRGPFDAVVELGCGYGRNLLQMYLGGGPRDIPYIGGELSDSGVEFAGYLARLERGGQFSWHHFDHCNPDLSFLPRVERLFVFTFHSLEQVRSIGINFFAAVASAAPQVTALHMEPFGFQVTKGSEATQAQAQFFAQKGWNQDLFARLQEAHASGVIALEGIALEVGSEDAYSPTSVALWTNAKKPA